MKENRPDSFYNASLMMLLHSLHSAVEQGNVAVVIRLLNHAGKNKEQVINQKDGEGNTPLHIAVITKYQNMATQLKLVDQLIRSGANINTLNNYQQTALHIAINKGCVDFTYNILIKKLIEFGADVNAAPDEPGEALLEAVAASRNKEVVSLLKQNGIEKDSAKRISFRYFRKKYCVVM